LAPGLGTEQPGFTDQVDGTDQELIQVLDGDLDGAILVQFYGHCVTIGVGVLSQGGQEIAQTTFAGIDAISEPETFPIVDIAFLGQVAQGLGPVPFVDDLSAMKEKERYRVEGHLASGRGPAQALSQNRTQAGEIDQA
jgi:hypothetical protein